MRSFLHKRICLFFQEILISRKFVIIPKERSYLRSRGKIIPQIVLVLSPLYAVEVMRFGNEQRIMLRSILLCQFFGKRYHLEVCV